MLVIEALSARYGRVRVLEGVDLELPRGTCAGLIGRNGAGKTTLLRSVMNLVPERRGRIVFEGQSLMGRASHAIARLGIAYVPQGRASFGALSVGENLLAVPAPRVRLDALLRRYPLFAERWSQKAGSLSGGEARMLAIARASLVEPALLLMDEPVANLSPAARADVAAFIDAERERGTSVLVAEHDLDFLLGVCDRIHGIERGRSLLDKPCSELDGVGDSALQRFFGLL